MPCCSRYRSGQTSKAEGQNWISVMCAVVILRCETESEHAMQTGRHQSVSDAQRVMPRAGRAQRARRFRFVWGRTCSSLDPRRCTFAFEISEPKCVRCRIPGSTFSPSYRTPNAGRSNAAECTAWSAIPRPVSVKAESARQAAPGMQAWEHGTDNGRKGPRVLSSRRTPPHQRLGLVMPKRCPLPA